MKLVAGLGNPGRTYEHTRHNAGFEVVDELARRAGATFRRSWRWPVATAEAEIGGRRVLLAKPLTFMNASGQAIGPLARKRGIAVGEVLAVVDDVELDPGRLRLRRSGGAGGHNGLKSLIEHLGGDGFARLRVGVGRAAGGEMVEHVLGRFTPEEQVVMRDAVARAADAVEEVLAGGLEKAMNTFNG